MDIDLLLEKVESQSKVIRLLEEGQKIQRETIESLRIQNESLLRTIATLEEITGVKDENIQK